MNVSPGSTQTTQNPPNRLVNASSSNCVAISERRERLSLSFVCVCFGGTFCPGPPSHGRSGVGSSESIRSLVSRRLSPRKKFHIYCGGWVISQEFFSIYAVVCHQLIVIIIISLLTVVGGIVFLQPEYRGCIICLTMLEQQEQQKRSGSDYSRINYHPAKVMMPPDIVNNNNNNNNHIVRARPAIGVKPVPPPKPFPRPPPGSVRPPAALPPRPSSSYVINNSQQQQRRRPLTCVNDMAQNPLYMCRFF